MILKQTSWQDFLNLAEQAKKAGKQMVPIWIEMTEDMLTPVLAYLTLRRPNVPAFLFESVVGGERTSRWSYLGFNPFRVLTGRGKEVKITTQDDQFPQEGNPRQILINQLAEFSLWSDLGRDFPPFSGGLVGNIGYDAVRLVEPTVPDETKDDLGLPDITLMYFDVVVAFDHVLKKIYLIHLVPAEGDLKNHQAKAMARLQELYEQLLRPRHLDLAIGEPRASTNGVTCNVSQAEYEGMVKRCREHIIAGDAVQIVISQRFSSPLTVEPFVIYRCLRQTNPSPYLFFLDFGSWQMIGSSPEIMVNVKNRQVTISPIAGTRRRGKNDEEDDALTAELLADEKERAEHIMLVDLARNDVGRVAEPGTVRIPKEKFMYPVKYSTVTHIVSDVVGTLREDLVPMEALWASLPAGTLSGAPKVRAMQIIDELEPTRRGPYGGCVGFFGFDGNIETAIVIRTAVAVNGNIYWQAGAGIVYDSVPEREYAECQMKGNSIRRALVMAGNTKGGE